MSRIGKQLIEAMEEVLADIKGLPTGVRKHIVMVPVEVDVKAIRRRLKMTQRVFAERFGFSLGTVQNWERGHRRPEGAARALLKVIDKRPDAVLEALSADDGGRGVRRVKSRRAAAARIVRPRRKSDRRSST